MCESRRKWTRNVIAKQQQDVFLSIILLTTTTYSPPHLLLLLLPSFSCPSSGRPEKHFLIISQYTLLGVFFYFTSPFHTQSVDDEEDGRMDDRVGLSRECRSKCLPPKMLLICHFISDQNLYGSTELWSQCSWCGIYDDQCCFNNGIRAVIIIYRSVRKRGGKSRNPMRRNTRWTYRGGDMRFGQSRAKEGEGHMCVCVFHSIHIHKLSASACLTTSTGQHVNGQFSTPFNR